MVRAVIQGPSGFGRKAGTLVKTATQGPAAFGRAADPSRKEPDR